MDNRYFFEKLNVPSTSSLRKNDIDYIHTTIKKMLNSKILSCENKILTCGKLLRKEFSDDNLGKLQSKILIDSKFLNKEFSKVISGKLQLGIEQTKKYWYKESKNVFSTELYEVYKRERLLLFTPYANLILQIPGFKEFIILKMSSLSSPQSLKKLLEGYQTSNNVADKIIDLFKGSSPPVQSLIEELKCSDFLLRKSDLKNLLAIEQATAESLKKIGHNNLHILCFLMKELMTYQRSLKLHQVIAHYSTLYPPKTANYPLHALQDYTKVRNFMICMQDKDLINEIITASFKNIFKELNNIDKHFLPFLVHKLQTFKNRLRLDKIINLYSEKELKAHCFRPAEYVIRKNNFEKFLEKVEYLDISSESIPLINEIINSLPKYSIAPKWVSPLGSELNSDRGPKSFPPILESYLD